MTGKHLFTTEQKLEAWGYGEWVEEVDYMEWVYRGILCRIHRAVSKGENNLIIGNGQLNGYIEIPSQHPWINLTYHEIDCEVHGGLTFKEEFQGKTSIGFDCAHLEDETPDTLEKILNRMHRISPESIESDVFTKLYEIESKYPEIFRPKKTYKNINFVKCECESLVDQMLAVKVQ
jgi:hypothetical protein